MESTGTTRMKKLLIVVILILTTVFYAGYYEALEDGDIETILFLKKYPTLQMKFYNIHANDSEIRKVERLTDEERNLIIEYCRYRLGVDTELKTQDDVEVCRRK